MNAINSFTYEINETSAPQPPQLSLYCTKNVMSLYQIYYITTQNRNQIVYTCQLLSLRNPISTHTLFISSFQSASLRSAGALPSYSIKNCLHHENANWFTQVCYLCKIVLKIKLIGMTSSKYTTTK